MRFTGCHLWQFWKANHEKCPGKPQEGNFFASAEDGYGQDVDLDDPDFWEKSVGIEDTHESIGEYGMKVLFEKRIHNQVKVYDPYAEFAEVCPEPAILLLSGGTTLNEIIR